MLQVVNCNYEIMLKMQWNPRKQKLTDRLFRGFWIRECAHFHPVGQSPGEMCSRTKSQRGWRQERIIRSEIHGMQKVRRECQRVGTKDLKMKERGTYNTYVDYDTMGRWAQTCERPTTPPTKRVRHPNRERHKTTPNGPVSLSF